MKTILGLGFLSLFVGIIYGWIANIVAFIGMLDGPVSALFLARGLGILLAPLGVILGFV